MKVNGYYRPKTLDEAVGILSEKKGRVKILAGGTDLLIQINEREVRPEGIVDIGGLDGLRKIQKVGQTLEIGSMVSFSAIEIDPLVQEHCPFLSQAAAQVGSPLIRTSATVGGNFANGAAAADSIPVLLASEAVAVLVNKDGERQVPVEQLLAEKKEQVIPNGALLTKFKIPIRENAMMEFRKIGRRKALAIARINIAVAFKDKNGKMEGVRIALGAVGKTAYRVRDIEGYLEGLAPDTPVIKEAAVSLDHLVAQKLGDRVTAPYKRKIASAVFIKAFAGYMD